MSPEETAAVAAGVDASEDRSSDDASAATDAGTDQDQPDGDAGASLDAADAADASIVDAAVDAAETGTTAALSFDGTGDFVRVLRQVQADFTLEAWISTTTSRAGSNFFDGLGVIYADVSGSANDFGTSILNGKLAFGTVDLTIQSTTTVTTGVWVHIAAVRIRSSGTMRVLVNGTQEAQTTNGSTNMLTAPSSIDFGGNTIDSRFFNGKVDEVRIWNVARTAAQIQGTMTTKLVGNEAGLVGYWRFDDGAGNAAVDSSGSANNGSLGAGTAAARPTWVKPSVF